MPICETSHRRFFLDFETTGLDPASDQVLAVGLCGAETMSRLVSESPPASMGALRVHGLDHVLCEVRGRPSRIVLDELLAKLGPGPMEVVAHNASFERGFLESWIQREERRLPDIRWTCTLDWARNLAPEVSFPHRLGALAECLGWSTWGLHRAGTDAAIIERLFGGLKAWELIRAALGPDPGLVYMAGPLRGDGTPESIRHNQASMTRLCRWAQTVLPRAVLVVPHLNFAYLDESGEAGFAIRAQALRACEMLVARCDALILCGETLTAGMAREQQVANAYAIPVFQAPGWDAAAQPSGTPMPMATSIASGVDYAHQLTP